MGATYFQKTFKTRSLRKLLISSWDSYTTRNSISREVAEKCQNTKEDDNDTPAGLLPHTPEKGWERLDGYALHCRALCVSGTPGLTMI